MPYFVSKTDGTVITVQDGTKDTTSTSLTLIGRLAQNYGDQTNENFVRLLENFSANTEPAFPITGQLYFDKGNTNLKIYSINNTWIPVGSVIQGNVDISGNLEIGSGGFRINETNGSVQITNFSNIGNVSVFANVVGTSTRVLHINGLNGQVEVSANATNNFGLTTKIYVDSQLNSVLANSTSNVNANINAINSNLASRISEENQLRANITAANAQISLRDTISRVDTINNTINSSIISNVDVINSNLASRVNQTVAVETAMVANVAAANLRVNAANVSIAALNTKIDNNTIDLNIAILNNVATKADLVSPVLTGTPVAPTASFGANTTQIATTEYVMTRSTFWDGSRKFVSTSDPSVSDGNNGDIWFKYIP
jgi:hypothetical protein